MRILVCVKQVPSVMEVRLNETTGRLERDTVENGMNVFDLYALEAAARLEGNITALCMGPETAKSILRDALALAADEAYLVSDEAFAGSDLRATANILARAIRVLEEQGGRFDVICMGRSSTDGGAGVLPAMLAAHLGRPCVTNVLTAAWGEQESGHVPREEAFAADSTSFRLLVEQEGETEDYTWGVTTPCVFSFTKASYAVRYPDFARTIEAEHTDIPVMDAKMLFDMARLPDNPERTREDYEGTDPAYTSYTQVRSFRYHPVKKSGHVITGAADNVSAKLWKALSGKGVV